jgi:hypothetical protein
MNSESSKMTSGKRWSLSVSKHQKQERPVKLVVNASATSITVVLQVPQDHLESLDKMVFKESLVNQDPLDTLATCLQFL